MGLRVLVIEDDAALNDIVCTVLVQEGYSCTSAFSGSEARMLLERCGGKADGGTPVLAFDLVITDLMLPGCPGEELVPLARTQLGNVPVIVTSAKGAVSDRVALLRCGADDYLVKPFDLDELLARVAAQLRIRAAHAGVVAGECGSVPASHADDADALPASSGMHVAASAAAAPTPFVFGCWRLDPDRRSFTVDGVPVHLTRTEFDIVAALMARPDKVFTKRELYAATCHDEFVRADAAVGAVAVTAADERALTTHVGNLRAKLKATGTDTYLETVWGIGFKLRMAAASRERA